MMRRNRYKIDCLPGDYQPYKLYRKRWFFFWEEIAEFKKLEEAEYAVTYNMDFPKYYF